ncbi:MAG: hypothetical protein KAS30_00105 [Candidatus Diapherotrites archaeon]|nr:hypothetical protein [Candidatus Diapherotrites archaeon]
MKKCFVLDASGIINNPSFSSGKDCFLAPPEVLLEIRDSHSRHILDALKVSGNLEVRSPLSKSVERVLEQAKATGDVKALSKIDVDVLALALETGYTIITDDFALQNVAVKMDFSVVSASRGEIKRSVSWGFRCEGCRKKFAPDYSENDCDVCGSKIKRYSKKVVRRHRQ